MTVCPHPAKEQLSRPDFIWSSNRESDGITIDPDGYIYNSYGDDHVFALVAGVHLPQGAVVESFTIYYADVVSDTDLGIDAALKRRGQLGTAGQDMASISVVTTSFGDFVQQSSDFTIDSPTIDNDSNQYYIYIRCRAMNTASERFYGARLLYSIDTVAP